MGVVFGKGSLQGQTRLSPCILGHLGSWMGKEESRNCMYRVECVVE